MSLKTLFCDEVLMLYIYVWLSYMFQRFLKRVNKGYFRVNL